MRPIFKLPLCATRAKSLLAVTIYQLEITLIIYLKSENNYLGKAHNSCNLLMRRKAFIPIYGHNAKNYEFHILVKLFASRKIPMRIIPHTNEKYLTFSVRLFGTEMRMLDSYKLFASSLESAIEALPQNKFTETHKSFPDPNTHALVTSKMPFPYIFLSGPEALEYTQLPEKQYFRNDLADQELSQEL